jgi:hypothetical protein
MNKPVEHRQQHDLRERRKELHGRRRQLHERLSDVCEAFVTENLTRAHKKSALIRELRYLLDYYRDDESWQGID